MEHSLSPRGQSGIQSHTGRGVGHEVVRETTSAEFSRDSTPFVKRDNRVLSAVDGTGQLLVESEQFLVGVGRELSHRRWHTVSVPLIEP